MASQERPRTLGVSGSGSIAYFGMHNAPEALNLRREIGLAL